MKNSKKKQIKQLEKKLKDQTEIAEIYSRSEAMEQEKVKKLETKLRELRIENREWLKKIERLPTSINASEFVQNVSKDIADYFSDDDIMNLGKEISYTLELLADNKALDDLEIKYLIKLNRIITTGIIDIKKPRRLPNTTGASMENTEILTK